MSIHNFINKIKSKIDIKNITLMYIFIIVGVGISSFSLGRFSISNNFSNENSNNNSFIKIDNLAKNQNQENQNNKPVNKKYVASKNGKMYYTIGCSGVSRIKAENKIWFSSAGEAEKAGYSPSTRCK